MASLSLTLALAWPSARCLAQARGAPRPPPKVALMGHHSSVYAVGYSPDDRTLASSALDKLVRLWDVNVKGVRTVLKGRAQGMGTSSNAKESSVGASIM